MGFLSSEHFEVFQQQPIFFGTTWAVCLFVTFEQTLQTKHTNLPNRGIW